MPKTFTDHERMTIKENLLDEAERCLSLYGVRKTTVDELVKRVHIPKGTFYLFFESKELLFYEVLIRFHDQIQRLLLEQATQTEGSISPRQLSDLIYRLYKTTDDSFLIRLFSQGELELILRKLPPDIAREHMKKDDFIMEHLVQMVPELNHLNTQLFSAALRGIFVTMLHKEEIGHDVFDDVMKVMINGVIGQMFTVSQVRCSPCHRLDVHRIIDQMFTMRDETCKGQL